MRFWGEFVLHALFVIYTELDICDVFGFDLEMRGMNRMRNSM